MSVFMLIALSATAAEWTTGLVDDHCVDGEALVYMTDPLGAPGASALELRYGLWDSPDMDMDVYLNGALVFTAVADTGYSSPGPEYLDADTTGLTIPGVNELVVECSSGGEAVMGQLTLTYDEGGPTLAVEGRCPGPVSITGTGYTPGGSVAVLHGTGPGSTRIPAGPCAGTVSGLAGLRYLMSVPVDRSGEVSLMPTAPDGACGRSLQLLDLSTCLLSGVDTL